MKQKQWKDCPVCGAKDSMYFKRTLKQEIHLKNYPLLTLSKLEGYQCRECSEAILNIRPCRRT